MDIQQAKKHLQQQDKVLAKLIDQIDLSLRIPDGSYFESLVESIISQQLSVKASDTIYTRFKKLFKNERINPEEALNLSDDVIRATGISYQKISYIKDLAQKTIESGIVFEQFEIMTDEEIITELVKVKGIGRWTAEMFLMFAMGRPDVFSYGDLGLQNAIQRLYGLKEKPNKKQAEKIAGKWKPYRTLACRYLWKSLEVAL
jgi:DNA-3-methyladenine glycosylase II